MPFDDLLANRQSDTGTLVFPAGVQTLEDLEDALEILRLDADAIILHGKLPELSCSGHSNMDLRGTLRPEFKRISN